MECAGGAICMTEILNSPATFFFVKLLLIIGIVGLLQHLVALRCANMIHDWASQGGWRVSTARRKFFNIGPFRFNPGLPVYLVTLENSLGRERTAYVRCGHELISVLSDEMAVEWVAPEIAKD